MAAREEACHDLQQVANPCGSGGVACSSSLHTTQDAAQRSRESVRPVFRRARLDSPQYWLLNDTCEAAILNCAYDGFPPRLGERPRNRVARRRSSAHVL